MTLSLVRGYTYVQSTPSSEWRIQHNLGLRPAVQVYLNNDDETQERGMPKEIIIVDDNNITIQFSDTKSGKAILI